MVDRLRVDATAYMIEEVEPKTVCKHGQQDCERCGTSSRRDAVHTTRGGRGRIGSLVAHRKTR